MAFGKGIALAEFCILAVNFCGIVFFVFFFPLMLAPFFGSILIALLLVNFFLHFIVLYHSFKPFATAAKTFAAVDSPAALW